MDLPETTASASPPAKLSALSLAALGIVFGDIGTSPLYTFKTVLSLTGGEPDAAIDAGRAVAGDLDAVHHHHGQIRRPSPCASTTTARAASSR